MLSCSGTWKWIFIDLGMDLLESIIESIVLELKKVLKIKTSQWYLEIGGIEVLQIWCIISSPTAKI